MDYIVNRFMHNLTFIVHTCTPAIGEAGRPGAYTRVDVSHSTRAIYEREKYCVGDEPDRTYRVIHEVSDFYSEIESEA